MNLIKHIYNLSIVATINTCFIAPTHADITVDIFEDGPSVRITVTGGVQIDGLTQESSLISASGAMRGESFRASVWNASNGNSVRNQSYAGDVDLTFTVFTPIEDSLVIFDPIIGSDEFYISLVDPSFTVGDASIRLSPNLIDAPSSQVLTRTIPGSLASNGISDGALSMATWMNSSGSEKITFRTGSAATPPLLPPKITSIQSIAPGSFKLFWNVVTDGIYDVETSTDLKVWTIVDEGIEATQALTGFEVQDLGTTKRFWRVERKN